MAEQETKRFIPHQNLYQGDFHGIMRSPSAEFEADLHFHDFYEIQFYRDGVGTMEIGGRDCRRFALCLSPSFLLAACSKNANLLALFEDGKRADPVVRFSPEVFEKYWTMLEDYQEKRPQMGGEIYERGILYLVLANLFNDLRPEGTGTDRTAAMSGLLCYINDHLEEELSLSGLSQVVNFSPPYLCRMFRHYTGTTLKEYINLKRVERARQLLAQGVPAGLACVQAGFHNYSHFYKTVKRVTGKEPSKLAAREE